MSTEETIVETVDDDLDTFSADFFGQKKAEPEQASPEVEDEQEQASDAPEEDTHSEDTDTLADDEDDTGEEKPSEADPKPKKNRFQERIDELTGKAREAERREEALRLEFEALKAHLDKDKKTETSKTPTPVVENKGPAPDDKNEDGTDKYPLGEFDPQYIADKVDFRLDQREKEIKERQAQEAEQRELDTQRAALQSNWNEKLGPAKERYPDFDEKGQSLDSTFSDLDPAYGEYLAATMMAMDFGPDVLYYLANNIDEAKKIVDMGPTKATIALGRLEAKFAFADEEKQKARPKVSKAPNPPLTNKGSSVSLPEVPPDTDDLDAFSSTFFKKKGRG